VIFGSINSRVCTSSNFPTIYGPIIEGSGPIEEEVLFLTTSLNAMSIEVEDAPWSLTPPHKHNTKKMIESLIITYLDNK
jgi:hypothetical protein